MNTQAAIRSIVHDQLNLTAQSIESLGGGSINEVYKVACQTGEVLLAKTQQGADQSYFKVEANGLSDLAKSKAIRVPEVIGIFENEGSVILLMEYISTGNKPSDYDERIGHQIANLHRHQSNDQFGFRENNLIGATPQKNQFCDHWAEFWITQRMEPQFRWATKNGYFNSADQKLLSKYLDCVEEFLSINASPSLLHGDLWSGNHFADEEGNPVLIDPAVYYGHHEAEFGMTRLFGSFGSRFESAYQEVMPFADGYEIRFEIYKLYHLLNHLNLFGRSYYSSSMSIIQKLAS